MTNFSSQIIKKLSQGLIAAEILKETKAKIFLGVLTLQRPLKEIANAINMWSNEKKKSVSRIHLLLFGYCYQPQSKKPWK